MLVTWKYPLRYEARQVLLMPAGARPFLVHEQSGQICLWAEVDPARPADMPFVFQIVGTGHAELGSPEMRRYIGTAFVDAFVWHVYLLPDEG